MGNSDGDSGIPGGKQPELPPEEEVEQDFRAPVTTGRFVWTANPDSNRVALIDATSFGVVTLDAGFGPTYLAALPTASEDRAGALVINALSSDANVFLAKDTTDVLVSDPIPVHAGANAWTISESGRWAIAWTNARQIDGADPTEGFQDVTVIDLDGYPDEAPSVARLSVGYRPTKLLISEDEQSAFAVTEPGVSVIDLDASGGPEVLRDLPVSDGPAAEVEITPDGSLALVRRNDSAELNLVDLETGEQTPVELPGVPTDLDLSRDASFAVVVVRGVPSVGDLDFGAAGQAGAHGLAGNGGQAGEGPETAAGGAAGAGPGPEFSDSQVVVLPIPGIWEHPDEFDVLALPELVGSVVVPPTGDNVLLYTNAVPSDRVTIVDTKSEAFRTVELKAPVRALFATPDGRNAVGLLLPPQGSTKAGAFSLIPVEQSLPPKLQGTLAPTFGVATIDDSAVITTRDSARGVYEAYVAAFPSLRIDPIDLPSAPTASGIVADAQVAYIAQEHAEGRITFVDLGDARSRTLTGFELGVKVVDGE